LKLPIRRADRCAAAIVAAATARACHDKALTNIRAAIAYNAGLSLQQIRDPL
jgi:hypothetical protein